MDIAKIVLKNVAASWVGLGSQIIVTFLLTPFVIKQLGPEAYGVWLLLQGIVGYYGFVDMGLRAGLTQSITRRIAANDIESVRRHMSSAMPLLAVLGAIVIVVATIIGILLPGYVEMNPETAEVIWIVVLIQAVGSAVKMPITPYSAVLVGLQRYDIANAISVATRILIALSTWWVLSLGHGLVGLSFTMMLTSCVDSLIRMIVARRMLPGIRGAGFTLDRSELSEIGQVGVWNFLIGVSKQFIYFSDALVVGILFSAKAIAPYGIAASLVEFGNKIIVSATKVLFPTMTHLSKQGNLTAQRELFVTATRLTLGVSLTILILGVTWISPFLKLWLGETPENQAIHEQTPPIFLMLGLAFTFVGFQRAGIQLLIAQNRLKLVAGLVTTESVANLVLSLLMGFYFGPIGVAIGTLIPAGVLGLMLHLPIQARSLGCGYLELTSRVLIRPLSFALLLYFLNWIFQRSLSVPNSWGLLIAFAGGISLPLVILLSPILLSKGQIGTIIGFVSKKLGIYQNRTKNAVH